MGKVKEICEVNVADLVPYARNAKTHGPDQVSKIARSIEEFGFLSPCLIDREKNIIAGHGRVLAAKELGLKKVPCVYVEGLTEEQRRAYILADNRLTELGGWDMDAVTIELEELDALGFDITLTGFRDDWFSNREKNDTSRQEGNDEYNAFLDKFEIAKTTDDCYTPDIVYDAVAEWVAEEYTADRAKFVRPFYPGGDYQKEKYAAGAVVVDNPPFSILSEIVRFYSANGVRFFLFAPSLTLFSSAASENCTAITAGVIITYENGATVNTAFLTNLDDKNIRARTAPALTKRVQEAADEYSRELHKELPKYSYPDNVVTSAIMCRWSKYDIDFQMPKAESENIGALDAQKETGKGIYGKGYLLSDRMAAERAAAERAAAIAWPLSDREHEIIKELNRGAKK